MRVALNTIHTLASKLLEDSGLSQDRAKLMVDTMIDTSMSGINTHGIRLLETYTKELDAGRANIQPEFKVHQNRMGTLKVDADNAPGILAAHFAMDKAVEVANEVGICSVSVANSNHYGAASSYTISAAKKGCIAFSFTNSDALVAPYSGIESKIGTNPIAIAAPMADGKTFSLDMATSQIALSKINYHLFNKLALNLGWAVDQQGNDSSETNDVYSLQPLGGYKGQGLGMVVTMLCAILSDMPLDLDLSHLYSEPFDEPRKVSHFFIAIKINSFVNLEYFKTRCKAFCESMKNDATVDGENIFWPGEKEEICQRENQESIYLFEPELSFFKHLSQKYGITF